VVDVRSPAEYALDHIPGALNAPVLDDDERTRVGTLYKQVSPFAARRLGAALVARNIGRHIERLFQDKPKSWRPLVYCWRGGQRSGAMTHVLRQVGWQAAQLEGGYKSFRREVVVQLDAIAPRLNYVVLCGETGSGKSRLLEALAAQGEQVLDLEGLACHRGSVLGGLPQTPQPAQKRFETQLWQALRRFDAARPVYVEAESKKIGALRVPDTLITAIRAAQCVQLHASVAQRVRFLCEDYAFFLTDPALLITQLDCLRPLYGNETIGRWHAWIAARDWDALVAELLNMHYDPLYRRSTGQNFTRLGDAIHVELEALTPTGFERTAGELPCRMDRFKATPAVTSSSVASSVDSGSRGCATPPE
jgi:tRNA 2-selenouridine synthase